MAGRGLPKTAADRLKWQWVKKRRAPQTMDNGDLTNLSPQKGALMTTEFIGVQVRFSDSKLLAATGLSIPETFLLQVPSQAIPMMGDQIALQDYLYADGSPVLVKVIGRTFGISSTTRKYMPYLEVVLVSTLALDGH